MAIRIDYLPALDAWVGWNQCGGSRNEQHWHLGIVASSDDLALALCVLLGGFEGNSEASRGTVADLLFLVVSEQCVQLWDAARDSTG